MSGPPRRNPSPLDVLVAPARLLERSRGIVQLCLWLFVFLAMMAVAVAIRRAANLNGLPDVGDPVDLAALRAVRLPDDKNAYVLYEKAIEALSDRPDVAGLEVPAYNFDPAHDATFEDLVGPCAAALDLWKQGSERPDARAGAGRSSADPTLFVLVRLAAAKATLLERENDLAGAWSWYRAALRCTRHMGQHAPWRGRSAGIALFDKLAPRIVAWSDHARIDHEVLEPAMADIQALGPMTPTLASTLREDYADARDRLAEHRNGRGLRGLGDVFDPKRVDDFLRNEPERSRRVLRLIYANWLAEALKRPGAHRPPVNEVPVLYADPEFPRSARAIPPAKLTEWFEQTDVKDLPIDLFSTAEADLFDAPAVESQLVGTLLVHLAERRYFVDHKEMPTSLTDVVGPYIDRLPDSFRAK